ncbi:MAG: hypothetical protein QOE37_1971 [Microbacteriaceae bacterium]|jgi:hypothetical protein|nr:hypothetical protein [Microbacteriaceae bacterium]
MLRPYRLERELDRAVAQWLAWLPRWDPAAARKRERLCPVCPNWARELDLEDVPHGALHALTTSIDALITEHIRRSLSLEPFLPQDEVDRLRQQLRADAVGWIARQRPAILRTVDAYVEPKVQHLTALLLQELDAS